MLIIFHTFNVSLNLRIPGASLTTTGRDPDDSDD